MTSCVILVALPAEGKRVIEAPCLSLECLRLLSDAAESSFLTVFVRTTRTLAKFQGRHTILRTGLANSGELAAEPD